MSKPRSYWTIKYDQSREPVGVSFDPGGKRHPEKGDPRMQHNGGELLDLIRQAQRDQRERTLREASAMVHEQLAGCAGFSPVEWAERFFALRDRFDQLAAAQPAPAPRGPDGDAL